VEVYLPHKKRPKWEFPPEVRAILSELPDLTLCPKFRRASADKVAAHIRKDKCQSNGALSFIGNSVKNAIDLLPDAEQELSYSPYSNYPS
jgi:hypothetical protein